MARKQPALTTQEQIGALVSPQLLSLLSALHPPPTPKPGFDRDALLWAAAKADLVAFLASCQDAAARGDDTPPQDD